MIIAISLMTALNNCPDHNILGSPITADGHPYCDCIILEWRNGSDGNWSRPEQASRGHPAEGAGGAREVTKTALCDRVAEQA